MKPSTSLKHLTVATMAALAFNAANVNAAGLIDDIDARLKYGTTFSPAVAKAAPDDPDARGRAGGFMVDMEAALAAQRKAPLVMSYPNPSAPSLLTIVGALPQDGYEHLSIKVCVQKGDNALAFLEITHKGQVNDLRASWTGPTTRSPDNKQPCLAFIKAARAELVAATQAGTPQASAPSQGAPPVSLASAMAPGPR